MPVEEGVTYPRELPPPDGLPAGWKAIEFAYGATSKCAGQTYVRFSSADKKHKHVGSIKKCIELHAADAGLDAEVEKAKFEELKKQKAAEAEKLRLERGRLQGEEREQAIELFRKHCGQLEGSVIPEMKGWGTEVKLLPNCGQTKVDYFSPCECKFGTVKSVEAFLGNKILLGQSSVDDVQQLVEDGRQAFFKKHGTLSLDKGFNPIRRMSDGTSLQAAAKSGDAETLKELKQITETDFLESKAKRVKIGHTPTAADYVPAAGMVVRDATREPLPKGAPEVVAQRLPRVREGLMNRAFQPSVGLVAVYDSRGGEGRIMYTLSGLYYEVPYTVGGRPCYQYVREAEGTPGALLCEAVYLFWNAELVRWQVGSLQHSHACFGFRPGDREQPWELGDEGWQVLRDSFGEPDDAF